MVDLTRENDGSEAASLLRRPSDFRRSSSLRMTSDASLPPIELGDNNVVISGAGLAGSLLACHLRQKGLNVHVIERRPDPRKETLQAGRSINLALSERGINAMRDVGILDDVMKIAIPMYCRAIHLPGTVGFYPLVHCHAGPNALFCGSHLHVNHIRLWL